MAEHREIRGSPGGGKSEAAHDAAGLCRGAGPAGKRSDTKFDDKKFFTSLEKNFNAGKAVSARQWEAMLKLAVKYGAQLPTLEKTAAEH